MIQNVLKETGITATAGIGTNMYLSKVAMDIVAKHIPADKDGVRIAELDEMTYRKKLWNHRPLTSFWRVGHGIADRLKMYGIDTMGKIARCSIENEELLYRLFGINAELLIDHAWGWEPCTIEQVKAYKPTTNSFSSGQVLQHAYTFKKARVVASEMADAIALDLVDKRMVTNQIVLTIGYDVDSLNDTEVRARYTGKISIDHYGREVPKHANGTENLPCMTSSSKMITEAVRRLFDKIVNPDLLVRRLNLTVNHVKSEEILKLKKAEPIQLDLFTDYEQMIQKQKEEEAETCKERRIQETLLDIKKRFGKNAILKGINFEEGATARDRNQQIGGHKA
jgi:DNA polymerase V